MPDPVVAAPPAAAAAVAANQPPATPVAAAVPAAAGIPAAVTAQAVPAGAKEATLLTQKAEEKPAAIETKAEIKYDLKLPKDTMLVAADQEKIAAFARERGLSNEVAQAALEYLGVDRKGYVDSQMAAYKETVSGWRKSLETHPTLGGDKLAGHDTAATEVLKRFAPAGLMEKLQETGYANHPLMFEFLANVGKAMAPDKMTMPNAPAAPRQRDGLAERLFPSSVKK